MVEGLCGVQLDDLPVVGSDILARHVKSIANPAALLFAVMHRPLDILNPELVEMLDLTASPSSGEPPGSVATGADSQPSDAGSVASGGDDGTRAGGDGLTTAPQDPPQRVRSEAFEPLIEDRASSLHTLLSQWAAKDSELATAFGTLPEDGAFGDWMEALEAVQLSDGDSDGDGEPKGDGDGNGDGNGDGDGDGDDEHAVARGKRTHRRDGGDPDDRNGSGGGGGGGTSGSGGSGGGNGTGAQHDSGGGNHATGSTAGANGTSNQSTEGARKHAVDPSLSARLSQARASRLGAWSKVASIMRTHDSRLCVDVTSCMLGDGRLTCLVCCM